MRRPGVVLGQQGWRTLRFNGPENVLLVGPQRAGKGIGIIIPSALELPGHLVIIDIRGETWDATAGWRSQFSRCLRLNLTQRGSVRFSLPHAVRKGSDAEFMDAAILGAMMVNPGSKDPLHTYWEKEARAIITCSTLYEVHKRVRPSFSNMASFWSTPGRDIPTTLQYIIDTAPTRACAELAQQVLTKAAKEASGVLGEMMSNLFLYRDPLLAENTATCDFRPEDFLRHDQWTSLYLVMSTGEQEYLQAYLRTFLRLCLQRWTALDVPKVQITLILDEFTSLKRMDFFVDDLATLGGRGIRTLLAVQNVPQLDMTYGDASIITEQCKVRLYFAAQGARTGGEIAAQVGTGTATTTQQSWQQGQGGWRRSEQAQQHARALLTGAEATQIPSTHMVAQVSGYPPFWLKKLRYWEHRRWRERSQILAPAWRRAA